MNETSLQDRVALVTGAGRGIGKAIAIGFAQAGAKVVCAARTTREIEDTAQQIRNQGGLALAITCDATSDDDALALIQRLQETYGALDILVLNAGGGGDKEPIESADLRQWKAIFENNLYSALCVARAAIPLLKKSDAPKIITMGSGMGRKPTHGSSAYSCAKAALWMLTQALSTELLEAKIAVNEIIPGPVNVSPTIGDSWQGHIIEEGHLKSEFRKRPQEVLPLALFLATQPSHGPTGQSFALNRRLL